MPVQNLIFVDDILGFGSARVMAAVVENLKGLEIDKKFSFGIDKTHILKMILSRKDNLQELDLSVRQGKIMESEKEKYLGNLFNNKGNNSNKIKNSTERVIPVMDIINNNTTTYHVGHLATQIRLYLVRNLGIPSVYHAAETWTNLTKVDVKDIEKIHKQMLTKMLGVETSTPYIGILSELGEWPIRQILDYKRLMLLHNLICHLRDADLQDKYW